MQLDDADFVTTLTGRKACLGEDLVGAILTDVVSDEGHVTLALHCGFVVRAQCLRYNFDSLILELVLVHEALRRHNTASCPVLNGSQRLISGRKQWGRGRTEVGLHMNLVSWSQIFGEARTCSAVQPSRNWEYGLFTECL